MGMFERLGRIVVRFRFAFLVLWIAVAAVCYLFAPTLEEVGSSDETSFLPDASESQEAAGVLADAFPSEASPGRATLVFSRDGGLTEPDLAFIAGLPTLITADAAPESLRGVVVGVVTAEGHPELSPWLRSADGEAELAQVNLSVGGFEKPGQDAIRGLREVLATSLPPGLEGHVTGQSGIGADYLDAALRATDRTAVVTIVLVVIILLAIYRAPIAALAPLLTIGIAWVVARGILGWLAEAGWEVWSTLDTFIVVLVFGVGTDYTIFLISRVREETAHNHWADAARRGVGRIGGVITASAATVVVGLSAMAVARFGLIRGIGPALALSIVVTLLVGLTLTPAFLAMFGRFLFWPFHRVRAHDVSRSPWARLARSIMRRPGRVTLVLVVALGLPALAMPTLRSDFDLIGELPETGDGRIGYEVVGDHFDEGQLSPVTVLVEAPGADLSAPASLVRLRATHELLAATPGVASVTSLVAPGGDGSVPEEFVPSAQLEAIADRLVPQADDPAAALLRLVEEDTEAAVAGASEYLEALGDAFPGLSDVPAYAASLADLDAVGTAVASLRAALRVETQLGFITTQVTLAAGGGDVPGALQMLGAYFDDLEAAYPEVGRIAGYRDAVAALETMAAGGVSLEEAARLTSGLEDLSAEFADRPDAYLVSDVLFASSQGSALQQALRDPLVRLPGELDALAAEFDDRADLFLPLGLPGAADRLGPLVDSYLSPDGDVTMIRVILDGDPYENDAISLIPDLRRELRAEAAEYGPEARILAGGQTAAYADIRQTIGEDFWRVAAITVAGILVVLVLLLRALVAPLYLVATVLLSWMASLGLAALLFQDLLGHSGTSYFLPLIVFVLLVALGSDYNIFLMSRVREEGDRLGLRDGIREASIRTGTVITSAGIILAGTFAAMAVAPLRMLLQIGVTVALGVLIDTFVVRSMLVPAITALVGERAWWPWHRRGGATAGDAVESGSGGGH